VLTWLRTGCCTGAQTRHVPVILVFSYAHLAKGVETPSFSKQFLGFMTTNARNWQNRTKLSQTIYFDYSDVVNFPPKHSEFCLGRFMWGCGNWWKLYHEFEKYVALQGKHTTQTSGKSGMLKDCHFNNSYCNDRTMPSYSYSVIFFQKAFNPTELLCLRCLQSPIDSVMLISQYQQKCENKTTAMSITSLHIISKRSCKKINFEF